MKHTSKSKSLFRPGRNEYLVNQEARSAAFLAVNVKYFLKKGGEKIKMESLKPEKYRHRDSERLRKGEGKMLLTCVDAIVPGENYMEKAKILKKCGYDGMTVYADYETWTPENLKQLKAVKRELGIAIPEFAFVGERYGHLMDEDSDRSQKTLEMYRDSVRVSGELGALTEIEFDVKRVGGVSFEYNEYPYPDKKLEKKFLSFMELLCKEGEKNGTFILLEACNRYEELYINRQADAVRIVSQVQRKNTGILSDLFHMSLDEENLPEVLLKNQKWIRHIHLGDTNRRLPGKGEMNWERIAKTCRQIQYKGWYNLECAIMGEAEQELERTAQYLRNLFE